MNYVELARQKALKYGLNPDIFVRQIDAESSFNPNAVSSAGAIGLGQLMPNTARELGVDPTNPEQNLEGAAMYMKQQLDRFGTYPLALSAYNAGPSRVSAANGVPDITETKNYVSKILGSGDSAMQTNASSAGLLTGANLTQAAMELEDKYKQGQMEKPLFQKDTFKDTAGDLAVLFNSMRLRPDENIVRMVDKIKDERTEKRARNRTLDIMAKSGRDDLVAAVQAGAFSAKEAFATMFNEAAELRKLQAKGGAKTFQYQQLAKDLLEKGVAKTEQEALQMAVSNTRAGTTVNVGPQGVPYGDPPKDTAWARNEDGTVKVDERGVPVALPIQGTKLFKDSQKTGEREGQVQEETTVTAGVVLGNIDKIRKRMEESTLPTTGIFGQALRNLGGSAALDIRKLIEPIQASIGFDRLQRMRDASQTGGALGQVSERELDLLMSTLSNLDQAQSEEQFLQALSQVETRYTNIIRKFNEYPEDAMRAAGYEPINIGAPQPTQGGGVSPDFSKMTDDELDAYIRDNSL